MDFGQRMVSENATAWPLQADDICRAPATDAGVSEAPDTKRRVFRERAPRIMLMEPARLRVGIDTLPVQMLDISLGGAKLDISGANDGTAAFRTDLPCLLNILGMRPLLPGRIRWHIDGRLGFCFNEAITPHILDCIVINPSVQARSACLEGRIVLV